MSRVRTYRGLQEVTDWSAPEPGHWVSRCCGAHCGPRDRTCWNCGSPRNRAKAATLIKAVCQVEGCGTEYHLLEAQNGERIGMCPFYFDHHGWNAYYPPNFRPDLLWDLDGYVFDEDTRTVSKGGAR